jgi:hypothetical protein
MVLRSTEMIDALVIVLMSTMSLSPQFDSPTKLRKFVDEVAKRIRRNVANARADPNHGAHILGARRGGTA